MAKKKSKESAPLKDFMQKLWATDLPTGKVREKVNTVLRISIVSFKKFLEDHSLLWTASISYSVVISFVPTVIAVLMFGAAFVDIDVFFDTLHEQADRLGLDIDLYEYKEPIVRFIDTAAKVIGGIGIFITLWSATNVFRNLETALNHIFRVAGKRPFIIKVAQFIIALLFGAPLLLFGLTITNSILNSFRAPNIEHVFIDKGTVYAYGTKSYLARSGGKDDGLKQYDFTKEVNLNNQESTWFWNASENRLATETEAEAHEAQAIGKSMLTGQTIEAVVNTSAGEIIALSSGVVLRKDKNNEWYPRTFGIIQRVQGDVTSSTSKKLLFSAAIKSGNRVILSANGGIFLFSDDNGVSWNYTKALIGKRRVTDLARSAGGVLWAVGENNLLLRSNNGGVAWDVVQTSNKKLKAGTYFNYNTVFTRGGSVYIGGTKSSLLISHDNGVTWQRQHVILPKIDSLDIRGIYFESKQKGIVFTRKGTIRRTTDGGKHWQTAPTSGEGRFLDAAFSKSTGLVVVGEKSQYYKLTDLESGNLKQIQNEAPYIAVIGTILNFVATFLIIWVLFMVVLLWLPYTKISLKAAGIGAGFTSVVWVLFIFLFTYYANNLAGKTLALYGALAGIPLGLLLVYSSTAITLLGAELAYTIQYPVTYTRPDEVIEEEVSTDYLWYGFLILLIMHKDYQLGKAPTSKTRLLKALNHDAGELGVLLKQFEENGFIAEDHDNASYWPRIAAESLSLEQLAEKIHFVSLDIPEYDGSNAAMKKMKTLFGKIQDNRHQVFKGMTLADLLKSFPDVPEDEDDV